MPDEVIIEDAERHGHTISADFLTGSTEVGLDRIRTRLLDLTNRNRLLNFKHTKSSSLRVVDIPIDPVFARLRDSEKFPFAPVPEPLALGSEAIPASDYAAELGWNTSFDLDDVETEDSQVLPVLHYHEALDPISRKISSAAKTAIEESGMNMLYLIFGFLEWYESDDSKQAHLAPLVIVPVGIERTAGRGRLLETILEYSGEDIETNLSLVEKMRRDFGLEIPLLDDEDTPEDYFAKFSEILNLKKQWSIRRQVTLGLLSFGKLLMYRDLDPKTWPAEESIASHPLVRQLFEGSKTSEISMAEEFPIDAPEMQQDVPLLIRDADSSQHSALIHALRGQNLVIEGPPGTGKSQTITNLIAAALAKGKSVLFVSEKLAALEVVRSRLDDAGLGVFCLEVHSHKTKKGALIQDIAQRVKVRGSFKDPRDLDRQLSIVEDKKRLLTKYVSLINKTVKPFNATVFDILWARDSRGQEILLHRERLNSVLLPAVTSYTPIQFAQVEQFLSVFAEHLSGVLATGDSLEQHPWNWVSNPLRFDEEERILTVLAELRTFIERAETCCDSLFETAGIKLTRTALQLERAGYLISAIPQSGETYIDELLDVCKTDKGRKQLTEFVGQVAAYRVALESLSASVSDVGPLLSDQTSDDLVSALECFGQWQLENHSVAAVRNILKVSIETQQILAEAQTSFRVLLGILGCEAAPTLASTTYLLETIRLVEGAPFDVLHLRQPAFESEHIKTVFTAARKEAKAIAELESSLADNFSLPPRAGEIIPSALMECADILDGASLWQRLFGKDYKRAVKTYQRIALLKAKVRREEMSTSLRAVAMYTDRRKRFEADVRLCESLGPQFVGVKTEWEQLQSLLDWYSQAFEALPEHQLQAKTFREMLFSVRVERLRAVSSGAASAQTHRDAISKTVDGVHRFIREVPSQRSLIELGSVEEISECLKRIITGLHKAVGSIDQATIIDDAPLRSIPTLLSAAKRCLSATKYLENSPELVRVIGEPYRGVHTDLDPIRNTVALAEFIINCELPSKATEWLLDREYASRLQVLSTWLNTAVECGGRIQSLSWELATISGLPAWSVNPTNSWKTQENLAHRSLQLPEELSRWSHFLRVRIESKRSGLDKLTEMAEARILEPHELVPAFRFVFYNTLARSVFAEHVDLSHATGITQELIQKQFAEADREAIRLYSDRVAALIDKRYVPYGNQGGPVRSWTEMALLLNEINKQKRHIPIRQLIRRSAQALVALKPCFMMGPLSVAQYLAPGQLKFDLVVMDEASQLKPEDAIGALARGGQVVIVGDPKQLPPTSFFQRVSLDAEDESSEELRTAVEDGESILDVASTLFQPVHRLRWHYRSRHHSLIAFSNEEFYQRDLIIFPSAYHDDPSLGVKYHYLAGGVCENSRNPHEAAQVVAAVLEHMRHHPNESLGVVTLNFEQRELVEELLDHRLRDDPAAISFQERMKGGQEALFVKNLENVQGDERDVIFISTTYGPDARGNQFQRFGPINGPHGHRRLNVLFTRAKKRIVVFTSLNPDKIQTSASSPWGVRALKQYLLYARTGVLQQADDGNDQPTNDFERSVGTALKEHGYEVVPQVGVAGFFIDLGVRHPAKPGRFLIGIECDGASYHSGRSARDRDRLREEILVNLGWKIHRVWSTDWFKSRDSEIKRLLKRMSDLLNQDPAYRKFQEAQSQSKSLLSRLTHLRDTKMQSDFPNTPPERSLLSPDLLKEFLEKRPKTREEWFRKIPQQYRTSVDSKQVGLYLDRVLEIIGECGA